MRDTNLALKASGVLTTTTTESYVDFGSGDRAPLTYVLVVTVATGTGETLDCKIQECATSGGTYYDVLNFKQMTATGVEYVTGKLDGRYRKLVSTIAGTSPSFTISVYPVLGGHYEEY